MHTYEVWATRWDDPHKIEQVPARDLSFSLPLSEHGECSFSATVEPSGSRWRAALTPPFSGVLVTRDGVPVWSGWVRSERESGGRTFSFTAHEWGMFFATTPARVATWTMVNDHIIFRGLVDYAQTIQGQDAQVATTATTGASESDLTINTWDNLTTEEAFTRIANAEGGPEWYFGTAGTLDEPVRQLVLGDRLGSVDPVATLMHVEDTQEWVGYGAPPTVTLLSDLFPAGTTVPALSRRGGNVLEVARTRDTSRAATEQVATGEGSEAQQLRATATAQRLLDIGWPRMTRWSAYSTVKRASTLLRHAQADLAAAAGIATGWSIVTLDGDPEWPQVPRGSTMDVVIDTDRYGGNRPHRFQTRVLDLRVSVPDTGAAQIQWDLAEVIEVS